MTLTEAPCPRHHAYEKERSCEVWGGYGGGPIMKEGDGQSLAAEDAAGLPKKRADQRFPPAPEKPTGRA